MQAKITDPKAISAVWKAIGQTGEAPKTLTVSCPKAETPPTPCECGCGTMTPSLWVPGHDAKRKSFLFTEWRSGDAERRATAEAEMIRRDWPLPNSKKDREVAKKTA